MRLRVDICDQLAKAKGIRTVEQQAQVYRIGRSQLFRVRASGRVASLSLALRMAAALGTSVEILFERSGAKR